MQWFRHDSYASNDPKIEKLRIRYGVEGYGLYFYCLELIARDISSKKLTFELEHDSELIAHNLKMDSKKVEEILIYCVNQNLFEITENKIITCFKLLKRLDDSTSKNPQIKQIISKTRMQIGDEKQYVYLIKGVDSYKIGKTKNPQRRIKELKTIFPFEISMIWKKESIDMHQEEAELHKKFIEKRVNGEWFDLNDDDLSIIMDGHSETFRDIPSRLDKIRLEETREDKKRIEKNNTNEHPFNLLLEKLPDNSKIGKIKAYTKTRKDKYKKRVSEGMDINQVFEEIKQSDFLMGIDSDWSMTFDWLITNENNYIKILEGNYRNKKKVSTNPFVDQNADMSEIFKTTRVEDL